MTTPPTFARRGGLGGSREPPRAGPVSRAPEPTNGNHVKFAWLYDLCADTKLSAPAKLVATLTVLKLAGRKGHFKATHKAIGALCGMKYMTVRRAADDIYRENYWDITDTSGGANVYTIIPPDERMELWKDAVREYQEDCRDWLDAEKDFVQEWLYEEKRFVRQWLDAEKRLVQEWLDAEKQFVAEWLLAELDAHEEFQKPLFNAVMDRCENTEYAYGVAKAAWKQHQAGGLTLADALEVIARSPQDKFPESDQSAEMSRPLLIREQTPAHQ